MWAPPTHELRASEPAEPARQISALIDTFFCAAETRRKNGSALTCGLVNAWRLSTRMYLQNVSMRAKFDERSEGLAKSRGDLIGQSMCAIQNPTGPVSGASRGQECGRHGSLPAFCSRSRQMKAGFGMFYAKLRQAV